METIRSLDPVRSAPAASGGMRRIDGALSREADSDFSATLLAMAGHDLRQPLQVISGAHEVLGTMLRSVEQQHKLVQAALQLGFVDAATFDRVVDPKKMVKPHVATAAA